MKKIPASKFRREIHKHLDYVRRTREPLIITHRTLPSVIIMPEFLHQAMMSNILGEILDIKLSSSNPDDLVINDFVNVRWASVLHYPDGPSVIHWWGKEPVKIDGAILKPGDMIERWC